MHYLARQHILKQETSFLCVDELSSEMGKVKGKGPYSVLNNILPKSNNLFFFKSVHGLVCMGLKLDQQFISSKIFSTHSFCQTATLEYYRKLF